MVTSALEMRLAIVSVVGSFTLGGHFFYTCQIRDVTCDAGAGDCYKSWVAKCPQAKRNWMSSII